MHDELADRRDREGTVSADAEGGLSDRQFEIPDGVNVPRICPYCESAWSGHAATLRSGRVELMCASHGWLQFSITPAEAEVLIDGPHTSLKTTE
jgi:hypothetical protein